MYELTFCDRLRLLQFRRNFSADEILRAARVWTLPEILLSFGMVWQMGKMLSPAEEKKEIFTLSSNRSLIQKGGFYDF